MSASPPFAWISEMPGLDAAAVALAGVVGAMLGSFLNVVVHRVPRGRSVVTGRSHCPACHAAIGPADLVPVVSWMALRGRCRRCGTAIAARYPLVEALCGALLAALAAGEVAAGVRPGWAAVAVWAARAAVVVTVLAWALLAADGHDVSSRAVAVAVGIAAAVSAVPGARLPGVGWCGAPWPAEPPWAGTAVAVVVGAVGGWLSGQTVAGTLGRRAGAVVGAALGWQAAALAAIGCLAVRPTMRCRDAPARSAAVMVAVAVVVVCWRPVVAVWRQCCQAAGSG